MEAVSIRWLAASSATRGVFGAGAVRGRAQVSRQAPRSPSGDLHRVHIRLGDAERGAHARAPPASGMRGTNFGFQVLSTARSGNGAYCLPSRLGSHYGLVGQRVAARASVLAAASTAHLGACPRRVPHPRRHRAEARIKPNGVGPGRPRPRFRHLACPRGHVRLASPRWSCRARQGQADGSPGKAQEG